MTSGPSHSYLLLLGLYETAEIHYEFEAVVPRMRCKIAINLKNRHGITRMYDILHASIERERKYNQPVVLNFE